MSDIIVLNKPFQVLSQFTDADDRPTLKRFLPNQGGYYPAGRLDYDSEGVLVLTSAGSVQQRISDPKFKLEKTYWAQVDGIPSEQEIQCLRAGVTLKDGPTRPAKVRCIDEPASLWPRTPPIRVRKEIPTQWLEIIISEGRNRQVRRMTAAINHPTLRLIRASVGPFCLQQLAPGDHYLANSSDHPELNRPIDVVERQVQHKPRHSGANGGKQNHNQNQNSRRQHKRKPR